MHSWTSCNVKVFHNRGQALFHLITGWESCLFAAYLFCLIIGTPCLWLQASFWSQGLVAFSVVFCFLLSQGSQEMTEGYLMPTSKRNKGDVNFLLLSIQNEHSWIKRGMAPRAAQSLMWITSWENLWKPELARVSRTRRESLGRNGEQGCLQNWTVPFNIGTS